MMRIVTRTCSWILYVSLISLSSLRAQFMQQTLFPGDSSYTLIQKLVLNYKPAVVPDYSQARIKMYTQIYNEKDSVECVYTGHKLYLDPQSTDPIGYLAKNGNANGINCEHSFPQSKGAETGNARSDMHHLFPARAQVNEARSNYPFGEINDNQTDTWYYRSYSQSFKPVQMIDEYSESINGLFEPRERHKGNVARALFYFFTMYELQADRSFFESMKSTLCQWHLKDPVDSTVWNRSMLIGSYQENKANPFVLDCSLARRCYCPGLPDCNTILSAQENSEIRISLVHNVFSSNLQFRYTGEAKSLQLLAINLLGQVSLQKELTFVSGDFETGTEQLPEACYIILVLKDGKCIFKSLAQKL